VNPSVSESPSVPAQVDTRKHAKYQRKLSSYCADYGVESDRAIKYWVKIGKKIGRLPPLDEPAKMAAWWAFAMVTRVPDKLLALSESEPATVAAVTPKSPPSPATPPPATDPRDFSEIKSLDPAANVEALRHSLAITKKLLDDALLGTDENLIALRRRNYNDTFDIWRLAEQTLVKIQRERGAVIEREAIAAEIAQACETLALMRQSMPSRILVELEKLLPRRFSRILKALQPHLLTAVDHVRSSEEQILRNLTAIDSPAALSSLLAA
jgi:hypothetical protein